MTDYEKGSKLIKAGIDEIVDEPERTRFWRMMELLSKSEVQEFIRKANGQYWTKEELKRHALPQGTDAETLWEACKLTRAGFSKRIKLKRTGLIISYVINDNILKQLHELDLRLGTSQLLPGPVSGADEEAYLISTLMEEAIASSQLEGAVTSREAAKEMLREGRKPMDYSQKMVVNNYQTMRMIKDLAKQQLAPELLLRIQASITKGTLANPEDEGRFRTTDDVKVFDLTTGEPVYTPPQAAKVPDFVQDLCDFANDDSEFIHPSIKASILHFLVGYVHPFTDGNGRTARSMFYWYLVSRNCGLVEFLSISRIIRNSPSKYARAYKDTEDGENDATYFILYHLHVLDLAVKGLHEYLKRKAAERQQALALLRIPGVTQRQTQILQEMLKNPDKPVSFKEIVQRFGLQYQTARFDLLHLERIGLIARKKGGRRLLLFFVTSKLQALVASSGTKRSS